MNEMNLLELLCESKFEINQSPLLVIAAKRDREPTKVELLVFEHTPIKAQE